MWDAMTHHKHVGSINIKLSALGGPKVTAVQRLMTAFDMQLQMHWQRGNAMQAVKQRRAVLCPSGPALQSVANITKLRARQVYTRAGPEPALS
jgi:hypothetical protein